MKKELVDMLEYFESLSKEAWSDDHSQSKSIPPSPANVRRKQENQDKKTLFARAFGPETQEDQSGNFKKEGFMWKSDPEMRVWHKRYFVLFPGSLCYFKKKPSANLALVGAERPTGIVDLTSVCGIEEDSDAVTKKNHSFSIFCPGRTFFIHCSSASERSEWMQAVKEETVIVDKAGWLWKSQTLYGPTPSQFLSSDQAGLAHRELGQIDQSAMVNHFLTPKKWGKRWVLLKQLELVYSKSPKVSFIFLLDLFVSFSLTTSKTSKKNGR